MSTTRVQLESKPLGPRRLKPGPEALLRPAATLGIAAVVTALAFAVTPLSGAFGYVVSSYVVFLGLFAVDATQRKGKVAGRDSLATVLMVTCELCTVLPLILIVGYVVIQGLPGIGWNFFTESMDRTASDDPVAMGGAWHAIVGTMQQVGLASLIATPLGLLTAVYLSQAENRLAGIVRLIVDAMSGIPSIVAGLFIYTMFVVKLGQGFSGLAAALSLAVLMLPTVARTCEEVLRIVPGGLREASLALGAPMWRTMSKVVLPAARSGIVTAVILGVARIAGETAPLLLTALGSDSTNTNPLEGPQSALPLFAFGRMRNSPPNDVVRGWAGALVLIALGLALFTLARVAVSRSRKGA
jgi:phosphate transport system permease protein